MAMTSGLTRRLKTQAPTTPGRLAWVGLGRGPKPDALLAEIPQQLEIMAARLQNGENIYEVLVQGSAATGRFARALSRVSRRLNLGEGLDSALDAMAKEENSPIVTELTNKIRQSLRQGAPLSSQLLLMAETARGNFRVSQLKAAGRNEMRMLIPLVFVILPVTVAFAVFPSLGIIQLGF